MHVSKYVFAFCYTQRVCTNFSNEIVFYRKAKLTVPREVQVTGEELEEIAAKWGYKFKEGEREQYTTLLAATCAALKFVDEMEGKLTQPSIPSSQNPI